MIRVKISFLASVLWLTGACAMTDERIAVGGSTFAVPTGWIDRRPEPAAEGFDSSTGYRISIPADAVEGRPALKVLIDYKDASRAAFEILPARSLRLPTATDFRDAERLPSMGAVEHYRHSDGSRMESYWEPKSGGLVTCFPQSKVTKHCERTMAVGDIAFAYDIPAPDFAAIHAADQAIVTLLGEWRGAAQRR